MVEQIPAGLLVRPAEAAAPQPGDLYYAVPVDPRRLTVVVGVPYGEDVSAREVADMLAALPESARARVRLAPEVCAICCRWLSRWPISWTPRSR
ncbi:hypothetical protein NKH18_45105 [Streptomyces sp. M10(2022)]